MLSMVNLSGSARIWKIGNHSGAATTARPPGLLIQLDLSARICPTKSAGAMFALLMAITNTGQSAGTYLGGGWYDALTAQFQGDRQLAFHTLVAIAATFTAACWPLVPAMKWAGVEWK